MPAAVPDRRPGFVWRLQGDNGNNTGLKVSADPLPSIEEALARLERLTELGVTPEAFTFKEHFPPPLRTAG
jgi:hypothetical protein